MVEQKITEETQAQKELLDQDTREEMIDKVLKNRWTTAVDLFLMTKIEF